MFPLTGRKTELLEGGLRVPLIVRWPGVTVPGSETSAQVMTMDWLPTFLTAAGSAPDPVHPSDGIDIASALAGGTLPERTLFWRFAQHEQRAARRGALKYFAARGHSFLFDVEADPMERGNLKHRRPADFGALVAAWDSWNATMLPPDPLAGRHYFTADKLAEYFGVDS